MGLFDFITNKESAGITLEEYGESVANWADDQRRLLLDGILKFPQVPIDSQESLIQCIEKNQVYVETVCIGLNVAIYVAYAVNELGFSTQDNLIAMLRGVKAGLSRKYSGEGKEQLITWVLQFFQRFYAAVCDDFSVSQNDIDRTYRAFMSICNEVFKPEREFSTVELMALQPIIQNYPALVAQLIQPLVVRAGSQIVLKDAS